MTTINEGDRRVYRASGTPPTADRRTTPVRATKPARSGSPKDGRRSVRPRVTVCQVGTTRKITVKRKSRKDATVVRRNRPCQKSTRSRPEKPRASTTRATQVETGPSLLPRRAGKVTTWKKALAYTDGAPRPGTTRASGSRRTEGPRSQFDGRDREVRRVAPVPARRSEVGPDVGGPVRPRRGSEGASRGRTVRGREGGEGRGRRTANGPVPA